MVAWLHVAYPRSSHIPDRRVLVCVATLPSPPTLPPPDLPHCALCDSLCKQITRMVRDASKFVCVDMAITHQGESPSELPELLIGTVQLQ
jgi:hypothetical protein